MSRFYIVARRTGAGAPGVRLLRQAKKDIRFAVGGPMFRQIEGIRRIDAERMLCESGLVTRD